MKNVVSFETAKALRDAGFPIPDIQIGQVWYNDLKEPSVIVQRDHEFKTQWAGCHLGTGATGNMFKASEIKENCCFAPTATDIMKELGRHFSMSIDYIGWIVRHHDLSEHGVGRHVHENPAEACALAWLELKKK